MPTSQSATPNSHGGELCINLCKSCLELRLLRGEVVVFRGERAWNVSQGPIEGDLNPRVQRQFPKFSNPDGGCRSSLSNTGKIWKLVQRRTQYEFHW